MSGKKILVVDDDAVIVKTLTMKLQSAGYTVLTAADGSRAIKLVRSDDPDLLILDINFPADVAHGGGVFWDGFAILSWLERMNEDWRKPIIIITGGDPAKYEARAKDAGAIAFFPKPVNHEKLIQTIRAELGEDDQTPPPSA